MKIAEVIKICKKIKLAEIYNQKFETTELPDGTEEIRSGGVQWIGNGKAAYCMYGFPRITSDAEFFRQYDVPKNQQESFVVTQRGYPPFVDFEPYMEDEEGIAAEPTQITIGTGEAVLRGISYGDKLMFVPETYLKPFSKSPDDAIEYEVRHLKSGMENVIPYLYIREEMEAGAVIMPWRCRDNMICRTATDELRNFWYEFSAEVKEAAELKEENP